MSTAGTQRRQFAPSDLDRMETRLGAALREVPPRPAFVSNLRDRLEHEDPGECWDPNAVKALWVSLASVLGALVLIAALVRGIQTLVTLMGMLEAARRSTTRSTQTAN